MNREKKTKLSLLFIVTFSVFIILFLTISIFSGIMIVLAETGRFDVEYPFARLLPILLSAAGALVLGTIFSAFILRVPLKPIRHLIHAMNRLAEGHFDERLEREKGILGKLELFQEVRESFNALAFELQNTEILRSDFINNFSHEFKTPIVSISGFARILRRGGLPDEDTREYLDIIVNESSRLSAMATNVLNLSKVENQNIITNAEPFNLSEQVRRCILMLEKKWVARNIHITADFCEHTISGDMAMLNHVWINLIDNAIKYSTEGSELKVDIYPSGSNICVSILNHGQDIPPENLPRIYDKFWQGDTSHASEGSGIGLSLAKRIVELHKGSISATSGDGKTVFSVILPTRKSQA